MSTTSTGCVYLVGAGPGDIKLITIRGMECIKEADVIIYDYLVNKKFINFTKDKAEIIPVYKKNNINHINHKKICDIMLNRAKEKKIVLRLKGGDPFVFGRGGEEAEFLAENNIPFEIVPGITSGIAALSYAGIPVTHRKYSSAVTLITGHKCDDASIDWQRISKIKDTIVFYMSLSNLETIQEKLFYYGKDKNTKVAVIAWGTRTNQITITGTLSDIVQKVKEQKIEPPVIIVIGEVVKFRDKLKWFDKRTLFGKTIIVTRPKDQANEFTELLEKEGAEVIEFSTIEIVPVSDYNNLDIALENISKYNWIIFTSINGVKYFFDRLKFKKKDIRILNNIKICAIGPKTAEEIEKKNIYVDYVPEEYKAEGVISGFEKISSLKDLKILLPRAKEAREVLPEELSKLGAKIDVIPVYETITPIMDIDYILDKFKNKKINIITFTSSSTVTNFIKAFKEKNINIVEFLDGCKIAVIGPITADTAEKNNLKVDIMPSKYTILELTQAIKNYYNKV